MRDDMRDAYRDRSRQDRQPQKARQMSPEERGKLRRDIEDANRQIEALGSRLVPVFGLAARRVVRRRPRGVEAAAVLAGLLGGVHRHVGVLHQRGRRRPRRPGRC